jgi:hypothetical protein
MSLQKGFQQCVLLLKFGNVHISYALVIWLLTIYCTALTHVIVEVDQLIAR